MKKIIIMLLLVTMSSFLFTSCETNGKYEVEDTLVTVAANIAYIENQDARYRIAFGNTILADSLPFGYSAGLSLSSNEFYLSENELTQELKIWRLAANGSETLESTTLVTAPANGFIQLIQLSDDSPLAYFNPVLPPDDQITQTNAQFFFTDANQAQEVTVTVLAVNNYVFLTTGQNFNTLTADQKTEIGTFVLNKSALTENITLDLDLFQEPNGLATAFFYKITDTQTGVVVQDYNKSLKLPIVASEITINPEYKFSLFEWQYQSATVPFRAVVLINGEEW